MKNTIIIIILFTALSVFAQEKINFGFKAGITVTSPSADIPTEYLKYNDVNLNTGISYLFGGYIDLIKSEKLTITPELYYNKKTTSVEYLIKDLSGNVYSKIKGDASADFLIFGIEGKYFFDKKSYLPYLIAEPRLSFYLGDDIQNTSFTIPPATKNYISDRYKKLGFGLNLGAGMHFVKEKSFNMFFEALYSPDFFNILDDNEYKIKNTGFEFKVGIGF
jgi:hypothetical protein